MSGPASRRGFLRGLALMSAAAGTGAVTLHAAEAAPAHPDGDLIAAEAEANRTDLAFKAVCAARAAAYRAANAEMGDVPVDLVLTDEERDLISSWKLPGRQMPWDPPFALWRPRTHADGKWANPDPAWSGRGLRVVLARAVPDLGKAGRTPHLLKRWRSLLPIADAHAERFECATRRYRLRELRKEEEEVEKAWRAARERIRTMTAKSIDGLAVQVRMFHETYRDSVPAHYLPLLLSAASVSGVALNLREIEEAGACA